MFKKVNFNFEYKVILVMLVVVAVIFVTGVLAYMRFSSLLDNIRQNVRTDERLVTFHSLRNDLTELSNLSKTRSFTNDAATRVKYQRLKNTIDDNLDSLYIYEEREMYATSIHHLDSLVRVKIAVLDGVMYGEDPFRVQTALSKVVDNLEASRATQLQELVPKSAGELSSKSDNKTSASTNGAIELKDIQSSGTKLEELSKEEEKLLRQKKRAEKRNKSDKVQEIDSLLSVKHGQAQEIQKKFIPKEKVQDDQIKHLEDRVLTINQIHLGIGAVSDEELEIERKIKAAQLRLISKDNTISLEIAEVFNAFELEENEKIDEATKFAETEKEKTKSYATLFGVFIGLLLVVMVYLIVRNIRKNNLYDIALKRSNDEAEQLMKTRERLMTTISHEIRTPMHAITGFAEQLSKEELTAKQSEYLTMIQKSSAHLNYLLDDVLDFSKLQNEQLSLEFIPFNLNELITDVYALATQLIKDGRLELKINNELKSTVNYAGDPYRLRQILLNLVSNAIKFTDEGEVVINVNSHSLSATKDEVKISIIDSGIGMDPVDIDRAFKDFQQIGKGQKSTLKGTGLGLPITKQLVELHGGMIEMNSALGKGTTVDITIPMEKVEVPVESVAKPMQVQKPHISSVLIVDDESYNRKLLHSIFSQFDIRILEAENGREALEMIANEQVDLVLLDARMPIMNGEQTLKAIRELEDDQKRQVKIIFLSAAGGELENVIMQGDGFVSKPFSQIALVNEINRVCGGQFEENDVPNHVIVEQTAVINLSNLKSMAGNDLTFYKDMLETFINTTQASNGYIRTCVDDQNKLALADEAHKMASPCRHIGALQLHQQLKNLEDEARANAEWEDLSHLVENLQLEITLVLRAVKNELNAIN